MAKKKVVKKSAPKKAVAKKIVKKSAPKKAVGKTKSTVKKQTGTSNKLYDIKRQALPVGKRKSASGKIYYESRANRSDEGKLLGIGSIKQNVLSDYYNTLKALAANEKMLLSLKNLSKRAEYKNSNTFKESISITNKLIKEKKIHLRELKKLI